MSDRETIPVGDRALDLLILMIENVGNIVTKQELLNRVWPNIIVEDTTLRVHIASLRKTLGEGDKDRYIANVAGRGYCFVGQIRQVVAQHDLPPPIASGEDESEHLPQPPLSIVGREADVSAVLALLEQRRFVTIHGTGGIGKTTVAVATANRLRNTFEDGIRFLDLGLHGSKETIAEVLSAALGQIVESTNPTDGIIRYLRARRMLLIFDCCEHVIGSAAALAEAIFEKAPGVAILATSREPLWAGGEYVYSLPPLEFPSDGVSVNSENLLDYSAACLLLERAAAGGHRVEIDDEEDRQIIGDICRKVDGIALALELTARRISAHGLRETAALLDSRLALSWQGRRTALPRHQTLHATLDWSHELLSDRERVVLRRLSVFVGPFMLAEAQAVAANNGIDSSDVVETLAQLVLKSLLTVDPRNGRYRLLDTMRAYARTKLVESGEEKSAARRHAFHYRQRLSIDAPSTPGGPNGAKPTITHLGEIRAALEWSFSDTGDEELGLQLAAGSVHLFLGRSLLTECIRWCERALSILPPAMRGTRCEMALYAALGPALMFVAGNSHEVRRLIEQALEIAENLGDDLRQFQLLSSLHIYYRRTGDFSHLLAIGRRAELVASSLADGAFIAAANVILGVSHHLTGNLAGASAALDMALLRPPAPANARANSLDLQTEAQFVTARNLWLQGFPDQAVKFVHEAERETPDHPLVACQAIILAAGVFHFRRDWEIFESYTDRLIQYAEEYSLRPYLSVGAGFKGEVLFRRGEIESGLGMIRDSLLRMRSENFEIYASWLGCALAEGMAARGYLDQALAIMNEVIARAGEGGSVFNMPELLRMQGRLLAKAGAGREAEEYFLKSMVTADAQGALSWRLRSVMSFARLLSRQQRYDEARALLAETYGRFTEGFDTPDLKAANLLLNDLSGQSESASHKS